MSRYDDLAWRAGVESRAQTASGWVAPSRCVRRKESAFKRVLRALGVL